MPSNSSPRKRPTQHRKPGATANSTIDPRAALACRLDRNADLLLALNCHIAAERLSHRAAELRAVAP